MFVFSIGGDAADDIPVKLSQAARTSKTLSPLQRSCAASEMHSAVDKPRDFTQGSGLNNSETLHAKAVRAAQSETLTEIMF